MSEQIPIRFRPERVVDGPDGEIGIYPTSALDMAKIARLHNIAVEFDHDRDHRRYAIREAAEIWLPVISISSSILLGVGTNLLTDWIKELLGYGDKEQAIIHVEYHITVNGGSDDRVLRLDGYAEDLLAKIDQFEDEYRLGEGNDEA